MGSLVTLLPNNSVIGVAERYSSALPLVVINTTETVTIREYLCGEYVSLIRDRQEINLRWMQRYETNSGAGIATWYLDDVRIRLWDSSCFVSVLSEDFDNIDSDVGGITYTIAAGRVALNFCAGPSISGGNALYFDQLPTGETVFRRSIIVRIRSGYELGPCASTALGEFHVNI